jgi:hypothetical protein
MGFPPHPREWLSIVDITYTHEALDPDTSFQLIIDSGVIAVFCPGISQGRFQKLRRLSFLRERTSERNERTATELCISTDTFGTFRK